MNSTARKLAFAGLCSIGMFPVAAHAQLAPMYNELVNTVQKEFVNTIMAKMGLGVEGAVSQAGAQMQGEVAKGALANASVATGIEAWKQEQRIKRMAVKQRDDLEAPALTCDTVAFQGSLGNANQNTQARVTAGQQKTVKKLQTNTSTARVLAEAHEQTNKNFCTPEEKARGICDVNPGKAQFAGADQSASTIFHSPTGSLTFDSDEQGVAADGYIDRIVAAIPPEQLRGNDYGSNPRARAYVELVRRFNSIASMAGFSLRQVKESHAKVAGLGTATGTASIDAPGFAGGKADMSMAEAVQRFIAAKFSPKNIADAAVAKSDNKILRDMAQTQAMQIWLEQQTMHQDARTEAMMAMQLSLLTEKVLRPELDAQRGAANRATNAAR